MRFPPWAAFGGSGFYGPVPVELALFADAGVAWGNNTRDVLGHDQRPRGERGRRGARELFGFAVAEIDYVRPLIALDAAGCGSSICGRDSDSRLGSRGSDGRARRVRWLEAFSQHFSMRAGPTPARSRRRLRASLGPQALLIRHLFHFIDSPARPTSHGV